MNDCPWASRLADEYGPTEVGIWRVEGECDNPCFSGSHYTPVLGYFCGTYKDVCAYAESLPKWKTWGHGGSICKIVIIEIDATSVEQLKNAIAEQERLQSELKKVEQQLNSHKVRKLHGQL